MRNKASILVGLLWCLALLSLIVIGLLHTARMDLLVVKNQGDKIQAHYLALAGIEKAKALLYQDARDRSRSRINHNGNLYNDSQQFRDVALGRGIFRVVRRGRSDEGGGIIYGVSDEESRLNVNTAQTEVLAKLPGMTPAVATAIVNWRGANGAAAVSEAEYYAGLQPPYQPRNGPFQTVRELLMVRGVSSDLLLRKDTHLNGLLMVGGEKGDEFTYAMPVETTDLGWAGILTVDSTVQNVNATGQERVNIQSADETTLTSVRGITPEIARAIISYRGQNQFQSIADLLDVTPSQNQNQRGPQRPGQSGAAGQPGLDQSSSGQTGARVVSETLFQEIADDVTSATEQSLPGVININTASLDVFICLPGISRELAQAIISYRQSNGFFANTGELMKIPGITRDAFKQLAPLLSARSETFRIMSEGKINSTGARQRIQAVVQVGLNDVNILSWREDDL